MRHDLSSETRVFRKNVSSILEHDYGDFMRAANVYLNQLRSDLRILNDRAVNDKLDQMQIYLQFRPSWEVEPTRELLLRDAEHLEEMLVPDVFA